MFDTVDHIILLNKLDYYGIKGLALEWLNNYLSDRLQYIEIGGFSSHMLPVPYLALYYFSFMSMICQCSKFVKFMLLEDDTNIFLSDKSIDYRFEIFNNELINLSECFNYHYIWKTGYIVFGRGKKYSKNVLTINDTVITRVVSTKLFGIIISEDLKWKENTNVVYNKVSKSIGVLNKIRYILPVSVLSILYCTLILPY